MVEFTTDKKSIRRKKAAVPLRMHRAGSCKFYGYWPVCSFAPFMVQIGYPLLYDQLTKAVGVRVLECSTRE